MKNKFQVIDYNTVVNHHVTHLPVDGSVYFTDTCGYPTAVNGGMN